MTAVPASPEPGPPPLTSERPRHVLDVASILNPQDQPTARREASVERYHFPSLPSLPFVPPAPLPPPRKTSTSESPALSAVTTASFNSTTPPIQPQQRTDRSSRERGLERPDDTSGRRCVRKYPFVGSPEPNLSHVPDSRSSPVTRRRPVFHPVQDSPELLPPLDLVSPSHQNSTWRPHSRLHSPLQPSRPQYAGFVSSPDLPLSASGEMVDGPFVNYAQSPSGRITGSARLHSLSPLTHPHSSAHPPQPPSPSHSHSGLIEYDFHPSSAQISSSPSNCGRPPAPLSFEISVDYRHASKEANEKRRRNAEASARFRDRGKNKLAGAQAQLNALQSELQSAKELISWLSSERDRLGEIIASLPGGAQHLPLTPPAIPAFLSDLEKPQTLTFRVDDGMGYSSEADPNMFVHTSESRISLGPPSQALPLPVDNSGPALLRRTRPAPPSSPEFSTRPAKRPRRSESLNPGAGP